MADEALGLSITFQSGWFNDQITQVSWSGLKRNAHDKAHLGSTWMPFHFSRLKDPGQLEITFWFDPDDGPPIDQDAETITVTFPVPSGMTTGATWACSGGMTDFSLTGPVQGLMQGTATLKFSGPPTFTDAT